MATRKLFSQSFTHQAFCNNISVKQFWSRKPPANKSYSVVKPCTVSPRLKPSDIPEHVNPPPYYITGIPPNAPQHHEVKSSESIDCMREACKLARKMLTEAGKLAKVGTTTSEIDDLVTELAFASGAYPSPLNYRNFPKSVCTSVNNCICHGIPDSRELEDGDIINIDITVFLNGHHGDCSETFLVGEVDDAGKELVDVARKALYVGIEQCGPDKHFRDIGGAIESFVQQHEGFRVIPAFTGHGIGTFFHGPPDIYPCRNSYPGKMKPGQTFTIEPAVSEGSHEVRILRDRWTAVSPDNSRSAQFEHTVLITDTGLEILTLE